MTNDYDVIVIGSGLGGLTTGAILATEGLKVRLFERHSQPGGYATTFFRDRFEFEVALHELSGIGSPSNPGPLHYLFDALGLLDKLSFIPSPSLYRAIAPGLDITVPPQPDEAREILVEAFPSEREGIESLIGRVLAIGRNVELVKASGKRPSPARALATYPNLAHAAGITLADVLYKEIRDPAARLAIGQLWGYFGLPPKELSFLLFAAAFYSYLRFGGCLIRQKSQALAHGLVEIIQNSGSEVSLDHGIGKIISDQGTVKGVITDRNEHITAPIIVSNVSPLVTCNELIDTQLIANSYHERLRFGKPSLSSVCVYLGLSNPSRDIGITNHEVYLNQTLDMESQYEACLKIGAPNCLGICAYDVENPDFCPPGSGAVTLVTLSDGAAWKDIPPSSYPDIKLKMGRQMLDQAEAIYPGLCANVETAVVSTPLTNIRYTGNPYGAIYGFANTPEHNPGFRLDNKGPLEGLWFAGAWTQPSAGYQGVISSGQRVADAILNDRGADRVVPREMDIALELLDHTPKGALKGSAGKATGYRSLIRDLKKVGQTVKTKYKIPQQPTLPDSRKDTNVMVRRYHAERTPMQVTAKTEQTINTVTFRLKPIVGSISPFYAGQYFNVFVESDGMISSRPYSVSSPPGLGDAIDFTVKKKDSGFISGRLVDDVEIGDTVEITGPGGEFYYNPLRDTQELVGLAVGSGITPFISIIEDIAATSKPVKMLLIYGSRTKQDIIFHQRLEALERKYDWLDVSFALSKPNQDWNGEKGRVNHTLINRCLGDRTLARQTFFVCGPRELYRSILVGLGELGIPRRRIHLESYGPPEDITQESLWPTYIEKSKRFKINIKGLNKVLNAPAGETLLNTFERAGLHHPSHCRSDVCDSCRMRLVKGDVFVPSDEMGQRTGHNEFIHLCMAYPISDIVLSD